MGATYRWIGNTIDRRTNSGMRESWHFQSEIEAKRDAIRVATKRYAPKDPVVIELLWRSLEKAGWSITTESRQ